MAPTAAVPAEYYGVRTEALFKPELKAAVSGIAAALKEDYNESNVEIVDCPNLRQWGKVVQVGLGGKCTITDHGGEAFNHDDAFNKVEEKFPTENFRVNREMREKFLVYESILCQNLDFRV